MHTQVITDNRPDASAIPVNPVSAVPAGTAVRGRLLAEAWTAVVANAPERDRLASDDLPASAGRALPLTPGAGPVIFPADYRTEGVLSGREAAAPQFALGLLADEIGIAYPVAVGEMSNLMRVALYLSGATVADLEAARSPEEVEALAATAIARHGLTEITRRHGRDNEAIFFGSDLVREVLFPEVDRNQAAADAAARWQWKRLP